MGDLSDHFSKVELQCDCGCGFGTNDGDVDPNLILLLEGIRMEINKPVRITSGCRCQKHNADVGGVPNSAHTRGTAADIYVSGGYHRWQVMEAAVVIEAHGIGIAKTFVHVDADEVLPRPSAWSY